MDLLYAHMLGGVTMSPLDQQVVSQFTDSIQAFRELGVALAILFVLGLFGLGFIFYVYFGYRLKTALAARDAERQQAENEKEKRETDFNKDMLAIIAKQQVIEERNATNGEHLTQVIEAQQVFLQRIFTGTETATAAVNKVHERVIQAASTHNEAISNLRKDLDEHRDFSATAVSEILRDVNEIKERVEALHERMDLLFPKQSEWMTDLEELKTMLENVAKRCEEAKKGTGEHVTIPDIAPAPETADDLAPDKDAQEGSAAA